MAHCSVILVTYNSGASIGACLEALGDGDYEVVVVDNASQDDSVARVQEIAAQHPLQLLRISRNIEFAAAVNHGVRAASGRVLLVLNPDAIAELGAVAALLQCMGHFDADAAGGALLGTDGRTARGFTFRRLPTFWALIFEATLVNYIWPGNPVNRRYRCLDADYSQIQQVEQPAGACLAVTRKAWDEVGGFDEQFFPVWFEDVDLCQRLWAHGCKIMYCPEAHFRHSGAHSVGQLTFRQRQLYWYTNMLRYARKHFSQGEVLLLRLAILKGMLLRSLGAVFGGRSAPLGETLAAYWAVARSVV